MEGDRVIPHEDVRNAITMVVNLERDRVRGTKEPQVLSSLHHAGVQTQSLPPSGPMVQGSGVRPSPTHRPESTTRGDIVGVIVDVKQVDLLNRDLAGGQLPLLRVHLRDRRRSVHLCSKDKQTRRSAPPWLNSTPTQPRPFLTSFPGCPFSLNLASSPLGPAPPSLTTPLRSSP